MIEGAYVAIKQGRVTVVPFRGAVQLGDINLVVGQPFGTFMVQPITARREIRWLCNDSALLHFDHNREEIHRTASTGGTHIWALSFVRPWDGSPIAGPLMVVIFNRDMDQFEPLPSEQATNLYEALIAIGFRPAEIHWEGWTLGPPSG